MELCEEAEKEEAIISFSDSLLSSELDAALLDSPEEEDSADYNNEEFEDRYQ